MISETTRRAVADRAGQRCEYCQCPGGYSPGPFSIEHIAPRALGGSDEIDNLAWACMGCNGHKAVAIIANDPTSGELAPLFNPRTQVWRDHFAWSDDALFFIGLTPCGRATVARLMLNRMNVVNLRRILREAELHPPAMS